MLPSSTDAPVVLGRIASAYGIKGWVKLVSHTKPREGILEYHPWLVRRKGGSWQKIELVACKVHGKGLVAHIVGCDDRNAAEQYRGADIAVSPEQLPELAKDEYYWRQLEGLRVIVQEGSAPIVLGQVAYVMDTGANDVLVVRGCDDSLDERERLLPYLWGQVIQEVDLNAGEIRVDWDPDF